MADTVPSTPLRSPLARSAGRLAAATRASRGAVRLAELPFLAQIDVRLDAKGAAADGVGLALGVQLPLEPNTVVRAGELYVLWLGPDEWLVVGPAGSRRDLERRIRAGSGDEPVSVTDVSAQRHIRRPPTRLRVHPYYEPGFEGVYPRYYPGRNAVRDCNATYVEEYRPSGTVIVPRMNCFWRPG